MERGGNRTNPSMLNSDVLLLPSDKTALHNQIVHASSWRSLSRRERAGVTVLAYPALRVFTTHGVYAMPMCVLSRRSMRVWRERVTAASDKSRGFYWYPYTRRDREILPQYNSRVCVGHAQFSE